MNNTRVTFKHGCLCASDKHPKTVYLDISVYHTPIYLPKMYKYPVIYCCLIKMKRKTREYRYAKDPLVVEWLGSVAESTAGRYIIVFSGFLEWVEDGYSRLELGGYTGSLPNRLLELQKELNRNGEKRKTILRSSYSYVKERGNKRMWRTNYRRKVLSTIRSFFVYHLDEYGFPKEPYRKIISVLKSPLRTVEKRLSLVELKQVAIKSTPMYRAVIKGMLVSGMGEDEIVRFSNQGISVLEEAMANPVEDELIEIYLGPRKSNVDKSFYVYIGGGAYRELKKWLKVREKIERRFNNPELRARREREAQGVREFPDSIFVTNTFTPLSTSGLYTYFSRKMEQLGFIEKKENGTSGTRYNKNPHQIRSKFRTQWSKSRMNPDIGEYFMGHTVDSLDYNRAHDDRDYRTKEYLKALPYLDMDNERSFGQVGEEVVETLSNRVKELEANLAEATSNDLHLRLDEQQRLIDKMIPAFRMFEKMMEEERALRELRDTP